MSTNNVSDGVDLPFVRSAYNYDRNVASSESGLKCEDVSLAKQEFAEECDINTIIRRFNVGGDLPANVYAPTYGDFTGLNSYHEAANALAVARESFERMPADVRSRFGNDPSAFVDFCSDASNEAELRKLGLTKVKEPVIVDPPLRVEVVNPNGGNNGIGNSESGGDGRPAVGAVGKGVAA